MGIPERRRSGSVSGWIDGRDLSIGALSGVWATANTRAAIWDAMKRRETFATSGPRIKVRMFAGVGLTANPTDPVAMADEGYRLGTPMGADLGPIAVAPTFTVYAEKDPQGANLDRVQIIKGWVDERGDTHEKIIDVPWAGKRRLGAKGELSPVGNTVDLRTARYTNDIGAPTLIGGWTDADFSPSEGAFYYARALEIPTPRWGSPIWYAP